MRRIQRYHALSVFGDMKPHNYNYALAIGVLHFANPANRKEIWPGQKIAKNVYYSDVFEDIIKECCANGLLQLVDNEQTRKIRLARCGHQTHPTEDGKMCVSYQIARQDYDIQLTAKGRDCLGMEQIARDGDYSFYKRFDGSIDSAKKINPGLF
jgi:hypothetical protein